MLQPLPPRRLESFKRVRAQVNRGSLIRVQKNIYSVHSRLIGEQVDVRVHADHLEVWYAQQCVERLPRLRGARRHCVNYRHVIDTLVRKPGAFENYRYKDDLFPTSRFRIAYDQLKERHCSSVASREYLTILELAARENEAAVDDILRSLLDENRAVEAQEVKRRLLLGEPVRPATEVSVEEPDLVSFDCLLDDKEVLDELEQGCEEYADWTSAGAAPADVP